MNLDWVFSCYRLAILFMVAVFVAIVQGQTTKPSTKILFAVIEESKIRLYSAQTDGTNKSLLISDDARYPNASADQLLYAAISPQGDRIAYMLPRNSGYVPLFIMNADGSDKRQIADKAEAFHWSPDGKKILYSLLGRDQPQERTFSPFGNEWRLLDLETKKEEIIAVGREGFQALWSWKQRDRLVFQGSSIGGTWLFSYDLKTKRRLSTKMAWREQTLTNFEASFSPAGRRRVIALSTCCVESTFDIYELYINNRRGKRLVRSPDTIYIPGIKWNGENEFFSSKQRESTSNRL
jgi:Tol biopolymer transport system component